MFNKDTYTINCSKVTLGNSFIIPNKNIDISTSDPDNSLVTINGGHSSELDDKLVVTNGVQTATLTPYQLEFSDDTLDTSTLSINKLKFSDISYDTTETASLIPTKLEFRDISDDTDDTATLNINKLEFTDTDDTTVTLNINKLEFSDNTADILLGSYNLRQSFLLSETEYRINNKRIVTPSNDSTHTLFNWDDAFEVWVQGINTSTTIDLSALTDSNTLIYDMNLTFLVSTTDDGSTPLVWFPENFPYVYQGMFMNLRMFCKNMTSIYAIFTTANVALSGGIYNFTNTDNQDHGILPEIINGPVDIYSEIGKVQIKNPSSATWNYTSATEAPGDYWININLKRSGMSYRYS